MRISVRVQKRLLARMSLLDRQMGRGTEQLRRVALRCCIDLTRRVARYEEETPSTLPHMSMELPIMRYGGMDHLRPRELAEVLHTLTSSYDSPLLGDQRLSKCEQILSLSRPLTLLLNSCLSCVTARWCVLCHRRLLQSDSFCQTYLEPLSGIGHSARIPSAEKRVGPECTIEEEKGEKILGLGVAIKGGQSGWKGYLSNLLSRVVGKGSWKGHLWQSSFMRFTQNEIAAEVFVFWEFVGVAV